MTRGPDLNPKNRYLNIIQASLFLFLIIGTIFLLIPAQRKIDAKMVEIKESTIRVIENRLNRKISYSSVSPSLFMFLEFRDFKVLENSKEIIKINRIRVYYSFFDIVRGEILDSLKEIRIIKSAFNFNYEEDRDLINMIKTISSSGKTPPDFPDIKISGRNIKLTLSNGGQSLTIKKLFFNISHRNKSLDYKIKGNLSISPEKLSILEGRTDFLLSGSLNDNFDDISTRIVLKSLENNYFAIDRLSLKVSYRNGLVRIRKIEDDRPLDINIGYLTGSKDIDLNIVSENFIPLEHFRAKSIDPSVIQWLSSSFSGNFELKYSTETGKAEYSANLKAAVNNINIPIPVFIDTSFTGSNYTVKFSKLRVSGDEGYLQYKGSVNFRDLSLSGDLLVDYTLNNTAVYARINLNKVDNLLYIQGKDILINKNKIFNLKSRIVLYRKDFDFQTTFSLGEPKEEEEINPSDIVSIDGNLQFETEYFLNLNMKSVNTPLNTLLDLLPDNMKQYLTFVPDMTLDSNLFLSTDFKKYSFSAQEAEVKTENSSVRFSAFGNNNSIDINNLSINWDNNSIDANVKVVLDKNYITLNADALFKDLPYTFEADYYPDTGLFLKGNHGLSGTVIAMNNFTEVRLEFKDLPVPINENITEISLDTEGYIFKNKEWELLLKDLSIKNIPSLIPDNNISLKGTVSQDQIKISSLQYNDPLSLLRGRGEFSYNLSRKQELAGNFMLESDGNESYSGNIKYLDSTINVTADFTDAPINRFNKLPVTGSLNGNLSIDGALPNPDINLTVQLKKGSYKSFPLEIETSLLFKENILKLNYLRLNYQNQTLQKGSGEYDLGSGVFAGAAELRGSFNKKALNASIDFQGNTMEFNDTINLPLIFKNDYSVRFSFDDIVVDTKTSSPWNLQIDRKMDTVSFSGGPGNSLEGYINDNGEFRVVSRGELPVAGVAEGVIIEDQIDLNISTIRVDMKLLNLIPTRGYLEFYNGEARGSLNISGPLADPSFYGELYATGVEAGVSLLADTIDPFDTTIYFSDKTMIIGPETLKIKDAEALIGADFVFEKWIPGTYNVDINVLQDNGIHVIYDVPGIGLGLDGLVNGDLQLFGNKGMFSIDSDLRVDDCIIGIGQKEPASRSGRLGLSINMKFTTGNNVQFIWPLKTLPILQATSQSNQVINVNLDSLSNTFSVKGDIKIKHGGINYFQKSFYLTKGSILFNESELKFDPILDFTAKIKEVDSRGEVVNISLILDKTPLSKFEPRFESDPPLTDVEIFSILGTGIFTEIGSEKIDLTSALLLTSDLVTQFGIIQSFEKKVKSIFNLDLFSIRTQMIQNILIDRFVEDSSGISNGRLDSFGSYLNNTTLYLGKYFGNDIFLQALLQISNEQLTSAGQLSTTDELLLESTISLEWQTPFFLLGFSIKPDFNDPLSSIQNTSLKLSWDYSY